MPNTKTDIQGFATENADIARDVSSKGDPVTGLGNPSGKHEISSPYNEDLKTRIADDDTNVTPLEKELLRETSESTASDEDLNVRRAVLDNTDEDGDPLNESEGHPLSGRDLDIPGSEDDDENEGIGEEDEENNLYSPGDND